MDQNSESIIITKPYAINGWITGTIGPWFFKAKVYGLPSEFGIHEGRVSKLTIRETDSQKLICAFSRYWDQKPSDTDLPRFNHLLNYLEQLSVPD